MTPTLQLLEDARATRALLDQPASWTQRELTSHTGANCLRAAIWRATGLATDAFMGVSLINLRDHARTMNLERLVIKIIGRGRPCSCGDPHCGYIEPWNDAPHRTHADVIQLLDRAVYQAQVQHDEDRVRRLRETGYERFSPSVHQQQDAAGGDPRGQQAVAVVDDRRADRRQVGADAARGEIALSDRESDMDLRAAEIRADASAAYGEAGYRQAVASTA